MSNDKSVTAFPDGENLTRWLASIRGPDGTVSISIFYINVNS